MSNLPIIDTTECDYTYGSRDYDGTPLAFPCENTATTRLTWRDLHWAGHPDFEHTDEVFCDEHADEVFEELDTDDQMTNLERETLS